MRVRRFVTKLKYTENDMKKDLLQNAKKYVLDLFEYDGSRSLSVLC